MTLTQLRDDLKLRYSQLSSFADAKLDIYLNDAIDELKILNVSTAHAKYSHLISLYVMHLLTLSGGIKSLASWSIQDVSESYKSTKRDDSSTSYYEEFLRILRRIAGGGFSVVNS